MPLRVLGLDVIWTITDSISCISFIILLSFVFHFLFNRFRNTIWLKFKKNPKQFFTEMFNTLKEKILNELKFYFSLKNNDEEEEEEEVEEKQQQQRRRKNTKTLRKRKDTKISNKREDFLDKLELLAKNLFLCLVPMVKDISCYLFDWINDKTENYLNSKTNQNDQEEEETDRNHEKISCSSSSRKIKNSKKNKQKQNNGSNDNTIESEELNEDDNYDIEFENENNVEENNNNNIDSLINSIYDKIKTESAIEEIDFQGKRLLKNESNKRGNKMFFLIDVNDIKKETLKNDIILKNKNEMIAEEIVDAKMNDFLILNPANTTLNNNVIVDNNNDKNTESSSSVGGTEKDNKDKIDSTVTANLTIVDNDKNTNDSSNSSTTDNTNNENASDSSTDKDDEKTIDSNLYETETISAKTNDSITDN